MSAAENGQGAETPTPADKIADACQWAIFGAHSEPRTAESFRVLTAALQTERESVARLTNQIENLFKPMRDQLIDRAEKAERESESLRETNSRLRAAFLEYVSWHGSCIDCHPDEATEKDADGLAVDKMVNDALALTPDSVASEFAALRAEVARLTIELGRRRDDHFDTIRSQGEAESRALKAEQERDGLRSALEIYAKPENWDDEITATEGGEHECKVYTPDKTTFHGDTEARGGWEIAKAALLATPPAAQPGANEPPTPSPQP